MKVIFLAFANSDVERLDTLKDEDDEVYHILGSRYKRGDYLIHRMSFATPEKISQDLIQYRGQIAIFHFSGHAGRDKLLMNDQVVNASGIAEHLEHSVKAGVLRLVILNGCSTSGQVKLLKEKGVPVTVSTSAPVGDKSATLFSKRFWEKLVKEESSIEDAYIDALTEAKLVSKQDLSNASKRELYKDSNDPGNDDPLWRLDCISDDNIKSNPVPYKERGREPTEKPNVKLIETLYNSFKDAKNLQIVELAEKEKNGQEVEDSTKQFAIVNSIPFPIGVHLQRLICPTSGTDEEGYDRFGMKRLEQIAQVFQIASEFLGVIMIAQVWEIFLQKDEVVAMDDGLKNRMKEYIDLDEKAREVYNYIPLIQTIRAYLEKLEQSSINYRPFIDEQDLLKNLFENDADFREACSGLASLRERIIKNKIDKNRAEIICMEAEEQLCVFIKPLGFIHRYQLTSIQNIDILKFRHTLKNKTEYKHRIIKCMQAIGTEKYSYYYINTFLDNWGVILLKCKTAKINAAGKTKRYRAEVEGYLNLSPFVIDRNSFDVKADIAYIMFFKNESDREICYKMVKNPLKKDDYLEVSKQENEDDNFEAVRVQFNAFKQFIA